MGRETHATAAVYGPVELAGGGPAFVDALLDEGAEVFVVGVAGAVVGVEVRFEVFAGRPGIGVVS